jgi:AhpC/TSA family/Thiol:disulfide interchange protein DsbD, N-terminal
LEESRKEFKKKGLGVAAISYDSREVLRDFSRRKQITIPLLSDPDSKIIRAFGILNTSIQPGQPNYGIPFPGTYLVNQHGVVVSKFFEEDYRSRYAMGTVYTRLFGSPLNTRETVVENEHLTLTYYSSSDSAAMGNRLTLMADVTLKPKMHLYAPGVDGYKPVEWKLVDSPGFKPSKLSLPSGKSLYLPAIKERVLVYERGLRISQDVDISSNYRELKKMIGDSDQLVIEGALSYQACDDKICYLAKTLPLRWTIKLINPDSERVPEELRKR